jgi:hypothetical protein
MMHTISVSGPLYLIIGPLTVCAERIKWIRSMLDM